MEEENFENHGSQTRPETAHLLRKVETEAGVYLVDDAHPVPEGHYQTITGEVKPIPKVERVGRSRAGSIIKTHTCLSTLPNGRPIRLKYERMGKNYAYWECWRITEEGENDTHVARFHTRFETNDVGTLEKEAQTTAAESAFRQAIESEKTWTLKRASRPTRTNADAKPLYTMSGDAAKHYAGWYALCELRSGKYIPTGKAYEDIGTPTFLWKKMKEDGFDMSAVVLCGCCRFERRWVRLEYDPLVGQEGYLCADTSLTGDDATAKAVSTGEESSTPTNALPPTSPSYRAATSPATASGSSRSKSLTPV